MMINFKTITSSFLVILTLLLFSGCQRDEEVGVNQMNSFDITADGEHIIYSWQTGDKTSIYKSQIDGKNPKLLIKPKNNLIFENPSCSSDGLKLVFLVRESKRFKNSIWTAKINGDSLEQVLDTIGLITQAVFSSENDKLYFTKANEYAAYSPIGIKAPHAFDIYSVELKHKKAKRISSLNSYSLYSISNVDSNRLLMTLRGDQNGIFFFYKNSSDLKKVVVTNDTLRNSNGYGNAAMISSTSIICALNYNLVKIDLERHRQEVFLVSSGTHINNVRYSKKNEKIYFKKEDDLNVIHSVNIDGSNFQDIYIGSR